MVACFAQLPLKPSDAPNDLRYTCAVCVKCNPQGQQTWKAPTTQMDLLKKHAGTWTHFAAFQKMFPLSDDSMRTRILGVIPSLQTTLVSYASYLNSLPTGRRAKSGPMYNTVDLQQLQIDAMSKPSAAYWKAYCYGMGSATGTRGAGFAPKPPSTLPQRAELLHPPNHFQPAHQHIPPGMMHPPNLNPTHPTSTPAPHAQTYPQTHLRPALVLNADLAQMYSNAAARTQGFHTKRNASV